jgi:hypothetical protein
MDHSSSVVKPKIAGLSARAQTYDVGRPICLHKGTDPVPLCRLTRPTAAPPVVASSSVRVMAKARTDLIEG